MRHIVFVTLSMIGLAASLAADTRAQEKIYRLGLLHPNEQSTQLTREHTLPELARLGFVEGRNLVIEIRVGPDPALPALARELITLRMDAVIAIGGSAVLAAHKASREVPIVMFGDDPVGLGIAESLARPGGNVTGVVNLVAELDAKRLQLLHEAVPSARRIAALLHATFPGRPTSIAALAAVASGANLDLLTVDADGPATYPAAYAAIRAAGAQALVIGPNPTFFRDASRLAALALEAGLPTACEWADMARAGCLLGFGPNRPELRRRMADYVARIFRGANPAELPIEGPKHFELAVNLRTARALGLEVPPTLLARADEVIE